MASSGVGKRSIGRLNSPETKPSSRAARSRIERELSKHWNIAARRYETWLFPSKNLDAVRELSAHRVAHYETVLSLHL